MNAEMVPPISPPIKKPYFCLLSDKSLLRVQTNARNMIRYANINHPNLIDYFDNKGDKISFGLLKILFKLNNTPMPDLIK